MNLSYKDSTVDMGMIAGNRARSFKLFCFSIALFSLWIRSGIPVRAIGDAMFDDALFVKLAASLGTGHWLGPFDNLTLVKGMFYPLFILAAFITGIPLKVGEQLIYLLACYAIANMVRRGEDETFLLPSAMFLVLSLNPYLWTVALARVIREGIYITQTSLLVALTTSLAFSVFSASPRRRLIAGSSLAIGLIAASFDLTREEAPWIVPALAAGVLTAAFGALRSSRKAGPAPGSSMILLVRNAAMPLMVGSAAFILPVLAVGAVNLHHYGAFQTTEVQSYAFRHGYAALAGVEQDGWKRFVVFPKDARERAYGVSPAARELSPYLDGPSGESWRRGGCEQDRSGQHGSCPEILSGWFQWALRDAVAAAGHYRSAAEAGRYYERLAQELETACDRGDIHCLPPRATLAPPFRWSYVGDTLREMPAVAGVLTSFGSNLIGSAPSSGTDEQIAWFSGIVGQVEPPLPLPDAITGWLETAGQPPALSVQATPTDGAVARPEVSPASDIAPATPGSSVERFSFATAGMKRDSRFVMASPGRESVSLPLTSLTTESEIHEGDVTLHIDEGIQPAWDSPARKRELMIERIAGVVASIYEALAIPSIIVAALGMMTVVFKPLDRADGLVYALAAASGVGVVSRVAFLTYLDVTSIPSANILYLSPASPLLLIFIVIGCHRAIDGLRAAVSKRKAAEAMPS